MDENSIDENYLVLHRVLHDALDQAASGKGKDRHAMGEPFEEQLMCLLARQLGPQGPAFQVCKKVVEACRLPYPANVREVLGAINYAAGMVIEMERKANEGSGSMGAVAPIRHASMVPGSPFDLPVLREARTLNDNGHIGGCSCGCGGEQ